MLRDTSTVAAMLISTASKRNAQHHPGELAGVAVGRFAVLDDAHLFIVDELVGGSEPLLVLRLRLRPQQHLSARTVTRLHQGHDLGGRGNRGGFDVFERLDHGPHFGGAARWRP